MCGIYAEIALEGGRVDRERTVRAAGLLARRGPDDEGFFFAPGVALAHRRLSIIDLHTGRQPIAGEDGAVVVVYNGEIYNWRELRRDLEARGHVFTTRTDTEVLVHLYEELGEAMPARLNGAFAFVIWDGRRRRLFFCRDRMGIKPLYLRQAAGVLHIASEPGPLRAVGAASLDLGALDDFLTYGYVPCERTVWEGITQLPPASWGVCDAHGLRTGRYWEVPEGGAPCDLDAWTERLMALIEDAVTIRLMSDVPLGAFLSGGIDSSTVVGLMRRSGPVRAFTIGFPAQTHDETQDARRVAAHFGCEHTVDVLDLPREEDLREAVAAMGEPFADHSMLPTFLVSRAARRHVTVALSGDGGDELFAGYQWFTTTLRQFAYPGWVRRAAGSAGAALARLCAPSPRGVSAFARGVRCACDLREGLVGAFLRRRSIFAPELKPFAYSDTFLREAARAGGPTLHRMAAGLSGTPAELLAMDFRHYLAGDILAKVDRTSMYNSLEVRVPLLDYRVVEHVLSIDPALRFARGPKYLLKRAVASLLPADVLEKRKRGFGIPLAHYFSGGFRDFTRDVILGGGPLAEGYFERSKVEVLLAEQQSGRADWTCQLWALLVLSLWWPAR